MCDCPKFRFKDGWRGWRVPEAGNATYVADGDWIDLSHPVDASTPRVAFFPPPEIERIRWLPKHLINVTKLSMVVHIGTHMDAPVHLFEGAPSMHEVPVARMSGPGLVWPVSVAQGYCIEPRHLEAAAPLIQAGDILVLNTGAHRRVHTPAYEDHLELSLDSAQWIVDHGIKMLAVDTPTPDAAVARRKPDFDYPVHKILLGSGVLIAEHVTNLDTLTGQRVEVMCAALNITQGDGAPVRFLARRIIHLASQAVAHSTSQ